MEWPDEGGSHTTRRALRSSPATAGPSDAGRAMAHRLKTPEGRALYALRKHTPEPVFGIIKSALGFRQFLLRGLDNVRGEWNLVSMAYNVKRLFALAAAALAPKGDATARCMPRPHN